MNNDNDLNLHSMTKLSGWLRYCVAGFFFLTSEKWIALQRCSISGELYSCVILFPGIPSKAELNRILNSASATKVASDNQASTITPENQQDQHYDYVLPHETPSNHKHVDSSAQPMLPQQDKQVYQVTSKPDSEVTTSQSQTDLMNKLVAKAVQREVAKLKLDGLIKDALKSIKPKAHRIVHGTDVKLTEHGKNLHLWATPKPNGREDADIVSQKGHQKLHSKFLSKPIAGNIGVTRKPIDNNVYLRLPKGYRRLGLKVLGKTRAKEMFTTPKPFNSKAFTTNSPVFKEVKDTHYHEHENDVESTSQPGGEAGSIHQGGEHIKSQHDKNDDGDLSEIERFLKSPYSELQIAKTTEKPDQTTDTPEEKYDDQEMAKTPNEYTITIAPIRGDAEDHHRIKEPENKESYSPSLLDEIKELGLDEYYIKDGFQTPRVPKHGKFDAGQVVNFYSYALGIW